MSKSGLRVHVSTPVQSPYHTPRHTPRLSGRKNPFSTPVGTPVGTPKGTPAGTPKGTPKGTPAGTPVGTPRGAASKAGGKVFPSDEKPSTMSASDKIEALLADPNFGMISMAKLFWRDGQYKEMILPLSLLAGQWLVFFSVATHNLVEPKQCGVSDYTMKLLFLGICLIYFVESVRLIDNLNQRVRFRKVTPEACYSTIADRLHEDLFTILIFIMNLVIVFSTGELIEAMFNCLSMSYLSDLENDWQASWYAQRQESALRVYDTVFLSVRENAKKLQKRKENACLFRCVHAVSKRVFRVTYLAYRGLPLFTLTMFVLGVICK